MIDKNLTYMPHQRYCSLCEDLSENCDKIDFSKMKRADVQGPYIDIIILVKCSEFQYRKR